MKRLIILSFLIITVAQASAQGVLTFKDNAILAGDSVNTREILFMFAGNPGPDQIWDFSKIQYLGKNQSSYASLAQGKLTDGLRNSNMVMSDHGYEYYLQINENYMQELGLTSKDYSFVFSDPMLKMRYPFYYGERFTDKYSGLGWYKEDKEVEVTGDYTVAADGYGTLIFPDKVLTNAMRLRIEEKGVQINPCNSIERKIIRYLWYIPSARYAILGFTTSEYTFSGQAPKITYSGFINQKMSDFGTLNEVNTDQTAGDFAEESIVLFPNPFSKKLSYNYFLRKQMPVSIELMDMTGRKINYLQDNHLQPEGLHSGELDATVLNLPMGVYYLRFTFGKKVVVSKVVKM
jgi:hypothetical protein